MSEKSFFVKAHLVVASIRIHDHMEKKPPSIDNISQILSFSLEQTHLLCNKLHDLEIVEIVKSAYGPRIFIKDYHKIEELPKESKAEKLDEAIKKFQGNKTDYEKKVELIKEEQAEKRKNLFSDIEKKFKDNLNKT
jgi:hypothetical protein